MDTTVLKIKNTRINDFLCTNIGYNELSSMQSEQTIRKVQILIDNQFPQQQ